MRSTLPAVDIQEDKTNYGYKKGNNVNKIPLIKNYGPAMMI